MRNDGWRGTIYARGIPSIAVRYCKSVAFIKNYRNIEKIGENVRL